MIVIGNRDRALQLIAKAIDLYKKTENQGQKVEVLNDILMTREEASAFLKISKPTLAKYTKAGIIKGQLYGKKVLYRKTDLLNCGRSLTSIRFKTKVS